MNDPLPEFVTAQLGGLQALQAAALLKSNNDVLLTRALDIVGCQKADINLPLTTAEIRAALSEGKFFVEQLPRAWTGMRITVPPAMATHIAVLWTLANALVNNAEVNVVGS